MLNALNIAIILGADPGINVIVTGGEFKPPTLSLTGQKAAEFFKGIHVDKLFLATVGISKWQFAFGHYGFVVALETYTLNFALKHKDFELIATGTDSQTEIEAAKMVGDVLSKELNKGDKVIIIEGLPVAENAQMRKLGFLKNFYKQSVPDRTFRS